MISWKKPQDIELEDLPFVEDPFFAAGHARDQPPGDWRDRRLRDKLYDPNSYTEHDPTFRASDQRFESVTNGAYLMLRYPKPFSSPFIREKTADGGIRWSIKPHTLMDPCGPSLASALRNALEFCYGVPRAAYQTEKENAPRAKPEPPLDFGDYRKYLLNPALALLAPATAEAAQTPLTENTDAREKPEICELIYVPDQDLVIVLTREELEELVQQETITDKLAQDVLNAATDQELRRAKQALARHVNSQVLSAPLVKGTRAGYVEIHRLGEKKWSYTPRQLIDRFKQGAVKAFSLRTAAESIGESQPAAGPVYLRADQGRLPSRQIKNQFFKISVKIKEKWEIVTPSSGRFSIRPFIEAAARIRTPDAVVDKLDHWIAALNKNLKWSTSRKQGDRDHILELLEKEEIERPWYKRWFGGNDNARRYRVFDEDDLGVVRDTVARVWGDAPEHADWVQRVAGTGFADLNRAELAADIRARPLPESTYNVEAGAQLMRYAYGITAAVDFDLLKGKLAARADAELDLALFEGRAGGRVLLPDAKGMRIDVPMIRKDYENRYDPQGRDSTDHPTFDFNKTFLTVSAMQTIAAAFDSWCARHEKRLLPNQNGPGRKLRLTGHADRPGAEAYNQTLSEHRARVVYGYLTGDPAPWQALFRIPESRGGWGAAELDAMLAALGHDPGPGRSGAIAAFQNEKGRLPSDPGQHRALVPTGEIDTNAPDSDPTLAHLIRHYMALGGLKHPVSAGAFMDPPCTGAGETQPAADTPGPERRNRRVSWSIHELVAVNETREEKQVPLGRLRFAADLHIGAYVGANLMTGADIHFDINPQGAGRDEKGRLLARGVEALGPGAGAGASAFAGARAETGVKGALQWRSPDKTSANRFVELGSVGYTLIGEVGLDLTAKFQIGFDFESQKFLVKAEAAAALGPGCGGKLAFTVGVKHTYNFITMVYTQLRDNDFSFVDFFDQSEEVNAFDLFCSWSYQMLLKGRLKSAGALGLGAVGAAVMGGATEMIKTWSESWEEAEHAEQLVENILADADLLRHTTPEVKGRILYLLIRPDDFDYPIRTYFQKFWQERKKAVDTVLSWVQSKRHCREVLEHMGIDIPQGDGAADKALRVERNTTYIIDYLKGLGVRPRHWSQWRDHLPDVPAPGAVVRGRSPMDYV